MNDHRNVSGKITTESKDTVARVAYDMASALWFEKHEKSPSMDDTKFFLLVAACVKALTASTSLGPYKDLIKGLKSD